MKTNPKPPTILQMASTPHGLAARTEAGRIILWDGERWKDITPRWRDDGSLETES